MRGRKRMAGLALGMLVLIGTVLVGTAGSAAASSGAQTFHFKVAYWETASGDYWTCTGVHKVSKTGAITDNETCTTTASAGVNGNFVAGTYNANALVFPNAYPGGCGGYVPGLPGYSAPNGYTYWVSDYPGFNRCAQFASWTYAPTPSGGWTHTLSATY